MTTGVDNRAAFGVRNEDFECIGAGSADRYAGEDGLVASVAKAAKLVLEARRRKVNADQRQRAEQLLRSRVGQLFKEFEGDATAIANATSLGSIIPGASYNSLHISVRNPDYVPPVVTKTVYDNGSVGFSTDWTNAQGQEFRDVTPQEVIEDPSLGLELVIHNDFHL